MVFWQFLQPDFGLEFLEVVNQQQTTGHDCKMGLWSSGHIDLKSISSHTDNSVHQPKQIRFEVEEDSEKMAE